MSQPVDKEFCDERSGHILSDTEGLKQDIKAIKAAVDRMSWMVITTLLAVCGGMWTLLTASSDCSKVTQLIERVRILLS